MIENIENIIRNILSEAEIGNALNFVTYLKKNEMEFIRGKGYWKDKFYWIMNYKNENVCSILIGPEEKTDPSQWLIWSENSNDNSSHWFENIILDKYIKEIAWKNIDFCGNCGYCLGGKCKTIFGKEFNNVCGTTFLFKNPNAETLDFMKKMIEFRKNEIFKSIG